jgi:hypothetical protein
MSLWRKLFNRSETGNWRAGERVLARWHDSYFYPGRVHAVSRGSYEIVFDDGDRDWVDPAHIIVPDVNVGSRVFARLQGGPEFLPGTVSEQKGEMLQVQYDHGDVEWTSLSMVRVQRPELGVAPAAPSGKLPVPPAPATLPMDVGEPTNDSAWRIGDRVLARWHDLYWYPGTILSIGSKGYHILYDDGDQRVVQDIALAPLTVEEGETVQIRPKNQPDRIYAEATVTRVDGEILDVVYDDGEPETNTRISRGRFWRSPVTAPTFAFEEGDRVLACDVDGYIYPAEVLTIQSDRIVVQFADGPQRMLTPEFIRRFDLSSGQQVECRWKAGPQYFPGVLTRMEGERIHVQYDDGDEEWTTVRLVRIQADTT